jgi:hypothetical protein
MQARTPERCHRIAAADCWPGCDTVREMRIPIRTVLVLFGLSTIAACAAPAPPRFIVTATPLDLGVTTPWLCIAVDPANPDGIWWWHPGAPGCATRSSGVFHAEAAAVSAGPRPGMIDLAFRLRLHAAPGTPEVAEVRLVLEDDTVRSPQSRVVVHTTRRADLDLPETAPPPLQRPAPRN